MRPGLYEARSVDHPERVAYVYLESSRTLRRALVSALAELRALRRARRAG